MTATHVPERVMGAGAQALIAGPTNYIDGQWEDGHGEEQIVSLNPTTTELIRSVPEATTEQTERAILAARRAFDSGPWSGYSARDRDRIANSVDSVTGQPSLANPSISQDRKHTLTQLDLSWSLLDYGLARYSTAQAADRMLAAAEHRRKATHLLVQDVRVAYWRAASANQAVASKPGKPACSTVGTSGNCCVRRALVTASARSLPACTWGPGLVVSVQAKSSWPPIRSVSI